jgi:hypothetical protein
MKQNASRKLGAITSLGSQVEPVGEEGAAMGEGSTVLKKPARCSVVTAARGSSQPIVQKR